MYNISEFSKLINKSVVTLQRWDRTGVLSPETRSPTNRRLYSHQQYLDYCNIKTKPEDRQTIIYARVSSFGQKNDLNNQIIFLENYCSTNNINADMLLSDIGSGLNYKRKNFLKIVKLIIAHQVNEIIITHKDRWVRFGFEFFEWFCEQYQTKLTIINEEKTSPQEELCKDLLSIIHVFSSRLYGLRKYNFNEICKES